MTLEHNDPDCTGAWGMECWGGPPYYRCTRCEKVYYCCDEVGAAVKREHELGASLAAMQLGDG